ncbi:VOC family protein [Anderseniella sp. Alg231-50]|uniref:VOC family protein n=1 Tax=Anderseniella sp. Alg231-50 TaxID=1922226 RepID=UPI000D54C2C4
MKTRRAMPVLQVSDLSASVDYYNRLGFATNGIWGEPATFAIMQRGDVSIALQLLRAEEMPVNTHWAAYIYVDDAKAVHEEFQAAGIDIDRPPEEAFYGCLDFDVADPDGHLLAFGQDLDAEPHGPGLGADKGNG